MNEANGLTQSTHFRLFWRGQRGITEMTVAPTNVAKEGERERERDRRPAGVAELMGAIVARMVVVRAIGGGGRSGRQAGALNQKISLITDISRLF